MVRARLPPSMVEAKCQGASRCVPLWVDMLDALHRPALAVGQLVGRQAGEEGAHHRRAFLVADVGDLGLGARGVRGDVALQRNRDVDDAGGHRFLRCYWLVLIFMYVRKLIFVDRAGDVLTLQLRAHGAEHGSSCSRATSSRAHSCDGRLKSSTANPWRNGRPTAREAPTTLGRGRLLRHALGREMRPLGGSTSRVGAGSEGWR